MKDNDDTNCVGLLWMAMMLNWSKDGVVCVCAREIARTVTAHCCVERLWMVTELRLAQSRGRESFLRCDCTGSDYKLFCWAPVDGQGSKMNRVTRQ